MSGTRVTFAALLALVVQLVPTALRSQGLCDVNNQASCTVGGDATHAITLTITTAARLSSPSSTISLSVPSTASFVSGFSAPVSVPLALRSNTSYGVTISAGAATWTGSPGSAWQTKPATDLQWSLNSGGPFVDLTTTPVSISSGAATGTATLTVWMRVRYQWTLDVPGSYSLPVQFTLTAP